MLSTILQVRGPTTPNLIQTLPSKWYVYQRYLHPRMEIPLMYTQCNVFIYLSFFLQNNNIKTSKYTLLTFLPLNLFEQFQRLANFYFACLLILQLIDVISSLTPVTTAVPLVGVLTLIAIKDGYDDIVSIFQFWPILVILGQIIIVTTVVPFVGVLTLIAIKDGYDDIVSIFSCQFFGLFGQFLVFTARFSWQIY